jgi:hypothetical protein
VRAPRLPGNDLTTPSSSSFSGITMVMFMGAPTARCGFETTAVTGR